MTPSLAETVGVDPDSLVALIKELTAAAVTVATAESLTGGLLAALLTEVPGASSVVRGGLIVYATDLKHSLAAVDTGLLARRGPVDPDVAIALAQGARQSCGATIGVGLTGVAGPDPQNGVAVGTWYVAAVGRGPVRTASSRGRRPGPGVGSRSEIRGEAIRAALALLSELVSGAAAGQEHSSSDGRSTG